MDPGLELQLIWSEDDLYMFQCRALSGAFSGMAEFYAPRTTPKRLADALEGFPKEVGERRELELGTLDPASDLGGVRLSLGMPHAGAATLRVELRNGWAERQETAEVVLFVEPSAIDEFVRQLRAMRLEQGSGARLQA